MKALLLIFSICIFNIAFAENPRIIHVYVALCDNVNQGIVPVPKAIGNGQDAPKNLYWGCGYGVKTYIKKSADWTFVKSFPKPKENILERIIFKHKTSNTYLVADAYDGAYMQKTIEDFFSSLSGNDKEFIKADTVTLNMNHASLIAFVGHDGLMDFTLDKTYSKATVVKESIILACYSKSYFSSFIKQIGSKPLLWSTHLMAPEAYTLKAAIDGWILKETDEQIRERAAQAYNLFQKCGIKGARNLLVTCW
ncbi:MAG: hypothetical protein WCJ33_05025 [Pseudomonadota bacterium]